MKFNGYKIKKLFITIKLETFKVLICIPLDASTFNNYFKGHKA